MTASDPLRAWAIRNRRSVEIEDTQLWLAPPEYVIVRKLEFFRESGSEKHLRDIRGMLAVTDVDGAFLKKEIARRGLDDVWDRAKKPESLR